MQSGFLTGDLCIAQLLLIIHEIKASFDSNPFADVRGVFLDISKAFDKNWHKALLYKLKSYGVEGELLSLLECYLRDQTERVVSNGQNSDWRKINFGVSQGTVLGPLVFLIYINDSPDGIMSICKIFAGDTSLFSKIIDTRNSQNTLNSDLKIIKDWAYQWKVQFNPDPKKQANEIIFPRKSNRCTYPPVALNKNIVANVLIKSTWVLSLIQN